MVALVNGYSFSPEPTWEKRASERATQGLMGALSSFILIAAVGDLSVTVATVATGQKEVFYCSIAHTAARRRR